VRWCFITGEATSEAGLARLRSLLDAVGAPEASIANRYGSTEGWSMIACEGGDWHNPTPDLVYLEVADPDTGQPLPDGEPGLLLITHLRSRGTAFLRYAVGDVVRLSRQRCPACGRTAERIVSQPVRTKDLIKINGTLVNLEAVAASLVAIPGLAEYRIVLDHRVPTDALSGDVLMVEVAPLAGVDADGLAQAVRDRVQALAYITPSVQIRTADEIFDPVVDAKPKHVVDRRRRADDGVSEGGTP
jgi:phenylacetate-CoA ligase